MLATKRSWCTRSLVSSLLRAPLTSLQPRQGTLSYLSAQPPALAFWTGTRPQVVTVSLSTVPFVYTKRTAVTRSLVSRFVGHGRSNVLWPLRANHSWNYPGAACAPKGHAYNPAHAGANRSAVRLHPRTHVTFMASWGREVARPKDSRLVPLSVGPDQSMCGIRHPGD